MKMIFGKTRLELKVGIFVFIGLVILVTFVLLIGDFKTWTSGYSINFMFNFVNGVKIGAPVRFAGVDIGEVKDIEFVFLPQEKKVKVKMIGWVKEEVKIPIDSTVWVNTLGLLGEKYVEIMPGEDHNNYLKPNQTLVGVDPIAMHEMAELARSIAGNIDESIVRIKNKEGTVGRLLYDDTIYKELEALVTDIRKHPWKLLRQPKEKPNKR
ncbi:MAG: MCE family protein [Candidatus Omnitrophica bacterium]|nr:MCE family protein [Candidatus Omnitrophota bacterium]